MPANREPLHEASDRHSYYYRRELTGKELVPALAIAIGVGIGAFYVAVRLAQRTPLLEDVAAVPRRRRVKGSAG
jgi:hypothetical protein